MSFRPERSVAEKSQITYLSYCIKNQNNKEILKQVQPDVVQDDVLNFTC